MSTTAEVQNINGTGLSEKQRNGLAILEHLSVDDVNKVKKALSLGNPGVIGPSTLNAFVEQADKVGVDLSNAGVNAFKTKNNLGNTGGLAGVIGPQTASFFLHAIITPPDAGPPGARHINQAGLDLVKEFEGYARLIPGTTNVRAYPDPGTGAEPCTIGYGHTGADVFPGVVFTQAQAEAALRSDLRGAEDDVSRLVTATINDNQFSALVSFTFNVGAGALETSTLRHLLNGGDPQGAADQFPRFNRGGSGVMPGLVRRRAAERALFLS